MANTPNAKRKVYQASPFGIAVYPWVNRPDTKFSGEGNAGVYKVGLKLSGEEAIKFKEAIDAEVERAFTEITGEFTAGERKKWSQLAPYQVLEDSDGNPTGDIVFDFKQNASIKLKDGTVKDIKIGIKDSADNDMHKPVFGGSTLRVMYALRDIKVAATKAAGVRMDFSMVQVTKLSTGSGGGGFGAVEGGYVESDEGDPTDEGGGKDTGGDY